MDFYLPLQRVIHGDPDAPRNPRVGSIYLNLAQYVSAGIVTRRYLLRQSKTNATLKVRSPVVRLILYIPLIPAGTSLTADSSTRAYRRRTILRCTASSQRRDIKWRRRSPRIRYIPQLSLRARAILFWLWIVRFTIRRVFGLFTVRTIPATRPRARRSDQGTQ